MRKNPICFRVGAYLLGLLVLTFGIISCQKAEAPQPALIVAATPQAVMGLLGASAEKPNAELVTAVSDASFEKEVRKSSGPVLVDFWATWCGPCRMYGPIVDKLAEDYKGRLKVVRVDIDQNPVLAQTYGIRAIPTSLLIKKGKVVKGWVGLVSEEDLKVEVNKVIKKTAAKPKPAKT